MTAKVIALLTLAAVTLFWFLPVLRSRAMAKNGNVGAAIAQEKSKAPVTIAISTTSAEKRNSESSILWQATPSPTQVIADTIVVEPNKKFQKILGFGGAFTDSACCMFDQMSTVERGKLFHELFAPTALNLNLCRTCIGASDYATHLYSYSDGEADPDLKHFSIAHDKKYILPMLRQARTVNADLFLFSSPWSPPGWMKSNKSMLGGNMQRIHMPAYAQYFTKFLKAYAKEGVPVQAVTVQNEVDTDQDGRMPACTWPQEYEVDFVRYHLGPALTDAKLPTKVWIIDHNYNLWGRALASLEAVGLRQYVTGVAWHGYVGDAWRMTTVHDSYPDIDMFWTEGGPDYTNSDYGTDWSNWSKTFTGNLRNWCRGITVWNLALDEQGRPNIGPFPCGGLVTVNSTTKAVTYSGQYWALAQYSRYIKRGATRIESTTNKSGTGGEADSPDLSHVAFENEGGEKVMVVTNSGATRNIILQEGGRKSDAIALAPDSVTTLRWQ